MSTPSRRRLMKDFKRLQSDPPGGISGAPCSDNIMLWNAVIFGPGKETRTNMELILMNEFGPRDEKGRRAAPEQEQMG